MNDICMCIRKYSRIKVPDVSPTKVTDFRPKVAVVVNSDSGYM